jgi:hypothetical protein
MPSASPCTRSMPTGFASAQAILRADSGLMGIAPLYPSHGLLDADQWNGIQGGIIKTWNEAARWASG